MFIRHRHTIWILCYPIPQLLNECNSLVFGKRIEFRRYVQLGAHGFEL